MQRHGQKNVKTYRHHFLYLHTVQVNLVNEKRHNGVLYASYTQLREDNSVNNEFKILKKNYHYLMERRKKGVQTQSDGSYPGWKSQSDNQSLWPSPVMMVSPLRKKGISNKYLEHILWDTKSP